MDKETVAESNSEPSQANENISVGYGKQSVVVFSLGLSGSLIWGIGIIPSIIALVKVRKARQEIMAAEGRLHGLGLIKAGIALAIAGIVHFLATIALAFGAVWVINQIPVWVEDAMSSGTVAGVDIAEILPPVDVTNLGLPETTLDQLENILPEGQTLESLDLNMLLDQLESSGGLSSLDQNSLEELGLEGLNIEDLNSGSLEELIRQLETN